MKFTYSILVLALVITACNNGSNTNTEAESLSEADALFMQNSATVIANLNGFQGENLDYGIYANDFYMIETVFGAEADSIDLETMKVADKQIWAAYDFEMLTDPPNLLQGVDQFSGIPNGSVRHYSDWIVTKSATDSSEAKSAKIKLYETFDFDESGKILRQSVYGDFTGLMNHLNEGM